MKQIIHETKNEDFATLLWKNLRNIQIFNEQSQEI